MVTCAVFVIEIMHMVDNRHGNRQIANSDTFPIQHSSGQQPLQLAPPEQSLKQQ